MTPERPVTIRALDAGELDASLSLLEDFLRDGEPLPDEFKERLRDLVRRGEMDVISALTEDGPVGVLTLAFRPNVSLGGTFASVEDLYVEPGSRREGIGHALLREAENRCRERGVSYLEAQVEDDAIRFYKSSGFEREDVRVMSRSLPIRDRDFRDPVE